MENDLLKEIIKFLINNKEWLFSGLGIVIFGGIVKKFFFKKDSAQIHEQKVSENGVAVQAGRDVIIGIDEKRAREINAESLAIAKKDFSYEAEQKVVERVQKLENRVMPRLYRIEGALQNFADPSFQDFLIKMNKAAACTEREIDYDLLSELLVHRVQRKDSQKDRLGITKAVEIVDQVTEDALSGLTIFYAVSQWEPVANNLEKGLSILDGLYGKLPIENLPNDQDWLDELDVLDALRTSSISTLKKLEDYWEARFSGFVTTGIKKDGEKWDAVKDLLESSGLSTSDLIENVLLDGYFLLPVIYRSKIDSLVYQTFTNDGMVQSSFTEEQKNACYRIFDMYDSSKESREKVKRAFISKIDSYENLKTVRIWWNSIPHALNVTSVGRVLAHVNAKRCEPTLPDLN